MIGLGVGIDYALFVVTRHRGFLHEGRSVEESAGARQRHLRHRRAVRRHDRGHRHRRPAHRRHPVDRHHGLASAITVAVAMVAAVTLLPALLGLAGTRIDRCTSGAGAP